LTLIAPGVLKIPIDTHYSPLELLLVLFTYWMAIAGYYQSRVIQRPENAKNSLTQLDIDRLIQKVNSMMEEQKLYLDQNLNLNSFAALLNVNAKTASTLLNQHYHTSFNEFVNGYRVREVCKKLLNTDNQHLTITGIALESGFNSTATFHRAFKNVTGKSPKEYLSLRRNGEFVTEG
jgi:AraC-like DNA-binding protein